MMKIFKNLTSYQILFGLSNRGNGRQVLGREELCIEFGGEITEKESTWKTQA